MSVQMQKPPHRYLGAAGYKKSPESDSGDFCWIVLSYSAIGSATGAAAAAA